MARPKKQKITEKEVTEMREYLDTRFKTHNAQLKKIQNIRKDLIQHLGPYLLNAINYPKTILKKNQLGIGIGDTGIEIRIHLHSESRIEYMIAEIDWDGLIRTYPDEEYMFIIDKIRPILEKVFPKY